MEMKRTLLVMVMLVPFLASTLNAQSGQWRSMRNQSLIAFDWNCSRKDWFLNPSLRKTVERSIAMDDRGGPTTYGDRAFVMKLRSSGPDIYFVPTVCGATGNCTWRLYTLNPVRLLGQISGQYIYTYKSSGWPIIVTYTHMNSAEGILSTYVATRQKYRRLRSSYHVYYSPVQSSDDRPMPALFKNATPHCKDFGG